ncbi:MAG: NAD-dependent epimerase/dehydratase family protein [Turicibacter sp.]|nr:NAD-dependent epimerase/dehydratase family protein [Turicibacter sp.]
MHGTFLVTGAAGFIGSNLVEELLNLGAKVIGLDNLSNGRMSNIADFLANGNFQFVEGDIRDFELCRKLCEGVDFVLHQAALGSVPRSMAYPLIYEDNNIKGTANMLEAARLAEVKRFVYASSSSVYGDSAALPKKEGEEGRPLSPYALTKKINEEYADLYWRVYGLPCIGLRYFNVFGKNQNPDSEYAAVIPKFIKLLREGKRVDIYGNGEQFRDFTYITNVVQANIKACQADLSACGRAYNIAVGESHSVNKIYSTLAAALKSNLTPNYLDRRAGDIEFSLADVSAAVEGIGYSPTMGFEAGIKGLLNVK